MRTYTLTSPFAAGLSDFMGPCRQTVALMESSHESCSAEEAGGEQGLQAGVATLQVTDDPGRHARLLSSWLGCAEKPGGGARPPAPRAG